MTQLFANCHAVGWEDPAEEDALVQTVLGLPDRVIDPQANTHALTLSQRMEWWKLVHDGMAVNEALLRVRGLL